MANKNYLIIRWNSEGNVFTNIVQDHAMKAYRGAEI
jgi:hypothetical protein